MKILVWHGYLLSGTGSNIYTRALAREWGRAGHEVVVLPGAAPGALRPRRARVVRPELPGRLLPVFVLDRYEGLEPKLLQELTAAESGATSRRTRRRSSSTSADLVFANHVLLGGAGRRRAGARFAVKAHGSELEYSMRGRRARRWGRERRWRRRTPCSSARATSARCSRRSSATSSACTRCRPGWTWTSSPRSRARTRCATWSTRPPRPAQPGQRERAAAGRGQRRAARAFFAGRQADRPLLRQAALQQGRARAARGAARARRAGGGRRLRRLPGGAGAARPPRTLFTGRSSTAISSI